jgi:hypothetical protein
MFVDDRGVRRRKRRERGSRLADQTLEIEGAALLGGERELGRSERRRCDSSVLDGFAYVSP